MLMTSSALAWKDMCMAVLMTIHVPGQETWEDAVHAQDETMEHRVRHLELAEQLRALLAQLSERQQTALKLSYGLDGQPPLMQIEVGSLCTAQKQLPCWSGPFDQAPSVS